MPHGSAGNGAHVLQSFFHSALLDRVLSYLSWEDPVRQWLWSQKLIDWIQGNEWPVSKRANTANLEMTCGS